MHTPPVMSLHFSIGLGYEDCDGGCVVGEGAVVGGVGRVMGSASRRLIKPKAMINTVMNTVLYCL